jgi:hypothetical protein
MKSISTLFTEGFVTGLPLDSHNHRTMSPELTLKCKASPPPDIAIYGQGPYIDVYGGRGLDLRVISGDMLLWP